MMPRFDAVRACLLETAPLLDRALASAGRECARELLARPNGLYDLRAATDESYRLSKGLDLCYDRPATGLTYGLWYHARRVNACLRQVLPNFLDGQPRALTVYDLGAGTGAFLWAFALAAYAIRRCGGAPPPLHVVNVDSSPVMLDYLGRVWCQLARVLPEIEEGVTWDRAVNSWTRTEASVAEGWLCASYLFEHSDKAEDLSSDFKALLTSHQPSRVLLSTSQKKGAAYFDKISRSMSEHGYGCIQAFDPPVFSGSLREVNALRAELSRRVRGIRPDAVWDDLWHAAATFAQKVPTVGVKRQEGQQTQLFMPELPKRRDVELTPEQEQAAALSDRPTLVWGAAGSGKSIVLTERLRLLVEKHDYSHDLRILVTTFNKELVHVLKAWASQLLDSERYKVEAGGRSGGTYEYWFRDADGVLSHEPNLLMMHFDVLPTRIGEVHKFERDLRIAGNGKSEGYEAEVRRLIGEAIERVRIRRHEFGVSPSDVERILDVGFVSDELHRIVYGQRAYDRKTYLSAERPGRPFVVQKEARPRQVLWEVLSTFSDLSREEQVRTFLQRRIHLLDLLETGALGSRFTHLFVDEVQDCAPADFHIFRGLLLDPNQLFITGDLAQAVHMGLSASTRLSAVYPEFKNLSARTLEGSFRLPFRVSEALIPLSQRIRQKRKPCKDAVDVALAHPYKGSPPGVRPVIVAAATEAEMARKLLAVGHAYGAALGDVGFPLGEGPLILEGDDGLRDAIRSQGGKAWADTILRVKGLERPWVVWSTRATVPA
ncbi:MAG: UvrD-helicase domain-containing protein, partial [Rhodothermales bacterium]